MENILTAWYHNILQQTYKVNHSFHARGTLLLKMSKQYFFSYFITLLSVKKQSWNDAKMHNEVKDLACSNVIMPLAPVNIDIEFYSNKLFQFSYKVSGFDQIDSLFVGLRLIL